MLSNLDEIVKKSIEELLKATNIDELNEIKVKILGKNGEFTKIMKELSKIEKEKRAEFGKKINETKDILLKKFDEVSSNIKKVLKEEKLKSEIIDVTLPARKINEGSLHPVTKVINEIVDIMTELGFDIVDGPELEEVKYNFDALNIPKTHPSREKTDTFYINDDVILRTQTSPVQIRYMLENEAPLRMISIGKVYRPDYDVSHTPMFHQVEGLMIGEDVSFSNFKAMLEMIIKRIFGQDRNVRFRPHFFPFTEPSAEMDVQCGICGGKGCRLCKHTGWLEILGSGMVNIKVLKSGNIDSEKYQGFAFGIGVERIAMLKYGINDIRALYENDIRFLEQFK